MVDATDALAGVGRNAWSWPTELSPSAATGPLWLIAVALPGVNPAPGGDQVAEVVERAAAPGPCPGAWPGGEHAVVGDRLAGRVEAEGPRAGHRAAAAQEHAGGFAAGGRPAGDLAEVV